MARLTQSLDFALNVLDIAKHIPTERLAIIGERCTEALPYCVPTEEVKAAVQELFKTGDKKCFVKI